MKVEEEFQDVLQNIEFAIVSEFRRDNSLLDMNVLDAVNALARLYAAEEQNHTPPKARLTERSQAVYDVAWKACEFRLGRNPGFPVDPDDIPTPILPAEMVACLRRLRKSVEFWSKERGRQGYLLYIQRFII